MKTKVIAGIVAALFLASLLSITPATAPLVPSKAIVWGEVIHYDNWIPASGRIFVYAEVGVPGKAKAYASFYVPSLKKSFFVVLVSPTPSVWIPYDKTEPPYDMAIYGAWDMYENGVLVEHNFFAIFYLCGPYSPDGHFECWIMKSWWADMIVYATVTLYKYW